jgi:hypothetical protein
MRFPFVHAFHSVSGIVGDFNRGPTVELNANLVNGIVENHRLSLQLHRVSLGDKGLRCARSQSSTIARFNP